MPAPGPNETGPLNDSVCDLIMAQFLRQGLGVVPDPTGAGPVLRVRTVAWHQSGGGL